MHYKNGRPAQECDPVVCKDYAGKPTGGVVHGINPSQTSCNCSVVVVIPGGTMQLTCQSLGNMYHAEDAWNAIEAVTAEAALKQQGQQTPPPA